MALKIRTWQPPPHEKDRETPFDYIVGFTQGYYSLKPSNMRQRHKDLIRDPAFVGVCTNLGSQEFNKRITTIHAHKLSDEDYEAYASLAAGFQKVGKARGGTRGGPGPRSRPRKRTIGCKHRRRSMRMVWRNSDGDESGGRRSSACLLVCAGACFVLGSMGVCLSFASAIVAR
jgi:hypothetical protein